MRQFVLFCFLWVVLLPLAVVAQPADTTVSVNSPPLAALVDARALAIDPGGLLYVADAGIDAVQVLDPSGAVLRTLGGPGSREGQFDEPSDVDPTNGLVILVADAGNARIQRFSNELLHLGSLPVGSGFEEKPGNSLSAPTGRRGGGSVVADGNPVAVATGQAGETYVIDASQGVVLKWDAGHRPKAVLGAYDAGNGVLVEPVSLAVDERGATYVADRGREAVLVYDRFGNYVRALGEGHLEGVRSVAAGGGRIWIVTVNRLFEYDSNGRLQRVIEVLLDEPLVDVVSNGHRHYLLTPTHLYAVTF